MENIKIMGAGLSGLTAAINLAKAGLTVDVFEKRDDCGKYFQGDINGLENWSSTADVISRFESMNIKTNYFCESFKTVHLTDGKTVLENTFKNPMFYLLRRGSIENSLDQGLKKQALDSGVNIHFNSKVKKEDMNIISTGPAGKQHSGILKGILFDTESDDIAVSLINKKASNSGYCYLLITKGIGTICSVNLYDKDIDADAYLKKTIEIITKLFDFDIKNEKQINGIGRFLVKPTLVENGKLLTGEAAGLQDLLWGFGMRYAIVSGYCAASSIIENKNYKKIINTHLSRRIKTSVVNRFFCEKYGDNFYGYLLNQARKNDNWIDLLHKGYNPSWYSRVVYPFAKWSLSRKY